MVGNIPLSYVAGAAVHWYTMDQYPALEDYKDKYLDRYMLISTEASKSFLNFFQPACSSIS